MTEPLTLGTAGHVDHGKSALVRALTGVDTDRLPEERARGLSIELGYAALELPGGARMSVVDVPGHERFVRTMVAGATGIDLFLMVIAADDGVMPQTREHAAVLRALAVRSGVIAITKADLSDPELAAEEAAELLPDAPIVACAAPTGQGLAELRRVIAKVAESVPSRAAAPGQLVLHVDRVFTIRGAGTVVTGTLWSGAVAPGDRIRLLPSGAIARARAVQIHDRPVPRALAGQRVALNLAGVGKAEVSRGYAIVDLGSDIVPTTILDARLRLTGAVHNQRIQVHHGTRDVAGRMADLGGDYWQLRLEEPLLAARGDRVVVRSIAPPDTLGGGAIVDPAARRHGRTAAHRDRLAADALPRRHEAEIPAAPLPVSPPVLGAEARRVALRLLAAGHEPLSKADLGEDAVHLPDLARAGLALRVGRDGYAHPDALEVVRGRIVELIARDGSVTLADLRDDLGTSRKFAQALLEFFDAAKLTRRLPDDRRVLRGGA